MSEASLAGRLLVATPLIQDGTFDRAVILLLAHTAEGAFGVVLNQPSQTQAEELVPGWGARVIEPTVMFIGGPVGANGVLGLQAGGTVDLNIPPDESELYDGPLRLFAGSAGWRGGQLEEEIGERAWWVVDADTEDPFTTDPSALWRTVLRRQIPPVGWHAHYPEDVMSN